VNGFRVIGPRNCMVCGMPRGLEIDRAFLMGLLMAHRFLRASVSADATLQFSASMGLCAKHHAMMSELVPIRPTGERRR